MKNFYTLLFFFLILVACTKEPADILVINQQSEAPVTVENGILSFKNAQEFFNIVDSLNKLSIKEAAGYKANEGFLSLFTIRANYSECLATATEKSEYDRIILEHSEFLVKGDTTDFKILNEIVYPVINKDGIVKIGDVLHKFTEDGQIMLHSNDFEQMLTATITDKETENLKIFVYPDRIESKGICGLYQSSGWVYNGDRRSYIESQVIPTIWTGEWGWFNYRTYVKVKGHGQKRGTFGWRDYDTYHWLDVNCKATLNNGATKTVTVSITQDGQTMIVHTEDIDTGTTLNSDTWPISGVFDWIEKNIYQHRGMEGVTAENECGLYGK